MVEFYRESKQSKQYRFRHLIIGLAIGGVLLLIIIGVLSGEDKKTELGVTQSQQQVSEIVREEQIDFRITAEEIYSNYIQCQKDFSIENLIQQKYNGEVVEITGIVERTMDYYKDTLAAKYGIDAGKYIDKNKRYHICLADNQGHACVVWAYSSFPQLIEKIKKGDKITVTGQWQYVGSTCGIPDLMNSEIKKIY